MLGQTTFSGPAPGDPGTVTAAKLKNPHDVEIDPKTGNVFVADRDNNRVLRFKNMEAFSSGASAEAVFGQTNPNTGKFNAVGPTSMYQPEAIAFGPDGKMYVADAGFHRVLRFDTPSTSGNGTAASFAFGQANLSSGQAALNVDRLNTPCDVAVSPDGSFLWVADTNNNRVLGFPNPANANVAGLDATIVIGQEEFTLNAEPSPPSQKSLKAPQGLAISSLGQLWVADSGNHRVLRFKTPAQVMKNASADLLLGQTDYNENGIPQSTTAANFYSPQGLAIDETAGLNGSLWVTDRVQNRVMRFDDVNSITFASGASAKVILGQPTPQGSGSHTSQTGFYFPYGIAIDTYATTDGERTLWVADATNDRVLRFSPLEPIYAPPSVKGPSQIKTTKKAVNISGSASSGVAITKVTANGKVVGSSHWSFRAKLKVGKNKFKIVAYDALGRSSAPKTITVLRKKKK